MKENLDLKVIARISSGFTEKFGIPRQSGLAKTKAEIVFEPEYQNAEALRGIEGYTYLWLIWGFSMVKQEKWHPTVRPPRLGGNKRMGVFATRSPFRPNPIGLSSVKLLEVRKTDDRGTVLIVSGADMMNGTPVYDIKPYLPYVDCHMDASDGFTEETKDYALRVQWEAPFPYGEEKEQELTQILRQDPRPSYQEDAERIYGMSYDGMEIKFRVEQRNLIVLKIDQQRNEE